MQHGGEERDGSTEPARGGRERLGVVLGDLGSVAGNEMCYLGGMLGGCGLVFTPISAPWSNFNTAPYCSGGLRRGGRKMSMRVIEEGPGKL